MIDLCNKMYSLTFNEIRLLNILRINSASRCCIRFLANLCLPIILKFKRKNFGLFTGTNRNMRIIVSLTSFPSRISRLWMVIETIFSQTIKPDKILLYLSELQFPHREKDLPVSLLNMCSRGLELVFVQDDYRSHKKYLYVMQEYPDDIIVTVDDDIFYPTTMLESLLRCHAQYPKSIICRYAKRITWDPFSKNIQSSCRWGRFYSTQLHAVDAFLGTGGGTLFPSPRDVLYKDTLNINLAYHLCPLEDDLWINTMLRLKKSDLIVLKDYKSILPVKNPTDVKLYSVNGAAGGMTDRQLNDLILYYAERNLYPYSNPL